MRAILVVAVALFLAGFSSGPLQAAETEVVVSNVSSYVRPVRYRRYRRIRRVRRYPNQRYRPVRHPRRAWVDPVSTMYMGIGVVGDFIAEGRNDLTRIINSGGGLDLFLGFRFNRYLAMEFGYVGTVHSIDDQLVKADQWGNYDSGILHGVTLDAKVFLIPKSRRIEPFAQVGGGGYAFVRKGFEHADLGGGGFHLGGGVDIRFNRSIAIGIRALYKGIYMDNGTDYMPATDSAYFNQFTAEANLQLHF